MCYFSAFMICYFSVSSLTLQQNCDSLQVNIYLTNIRITYTDSPNFYRAGQIASLETVEMDFTFLDPISV